MATSGFAFGPENGRLRKSRVHVGCKFHPDATVYSDTESGDMVCRECGLVIGDRLVEDGAEWRNFSDGKGGDRSRVGAAEDRFFDAGDLTTLVGPPPKRQKGDGSATKYFQNSTASPLQKALREADRIISDLCENSGLGGHVANRALELFKSTVDVLKLKEISRENHAVACVYQASRLEVEPRSFKFICEKSGLPNSQSQIRKALNVIREKLPNTKEVEPEEVALKDVCRQLKIPLAARQISKAVLENIINMEDGKIWDLFESISPLPLTAAVVMLICAGMNQVEKVPFDKVAPVVGKQATNLGKAYKTLQRIAPRVMPKNMEDKIDLTKVPQRVQDF